MMETMYIIKAANGNPTAILITTNKLERTEYESLGKELMSKTQEFGVEQAGFIVLGENHIEMSGGEFCGNAARSAAILFSLMQEKEDVEFTMSGFDGRINSNIKRLNDGGFYVKSIFPDFKPKIKKINENQTIVDLGGIVHVVIEGDFPENYEEFHREITNNLDLMNREAVGVIWISKRDLIVEMHPVVWVRGIDSFFYETSCGSGSIATGQVTGSNYIVQPTGKIISVHISDKEIVLESQMEVVYEGKWN